MNVNRLYAAQIYVCSDIEEKMLDDSFFFSTVERNYIGIFVKNTIVYNHNNTYIDLVSNEIYKIGLDNISKIGQMYINLKKGLRPLEQCLEINFEKENMSRKRIIRTLSKSKLLNKKEDDK